MLVRDVFPDLKNKDYAGENILVALRSPVGDRLRVKLAWACSKTQIRVLRLAFPDARVRWADEIEKGKVLEWIKTM